MGSASSKEKAPRRIPSASSRPLTTSHRGPSLDFWDPEVTGDKLGAPSSVGVAVRSQTLPHTSQINQKMLLGCCRKQHLGVRYHSWVMELGKESWDFGMTPVQPPGNPQSPPQVPTEGAQHPKVPPARSPPGYFGPPRVEPGWK